MGNKLSRAWLGVALCMALGVGAVGVGVALTREEGGSPAGRRSDASSTAPRRDTPRLVCSDGVETFTVTGAAVGETLRSFESADAAADSAAAERGDEVRAALVGAEVDGNRYSLIAADGMVEAEVVVAKRDGQWTLLSFDTCVEAGPFADLPPLDVTIEESVERFNEYPTGSGLKDLTAGRLAEGVFGNPVTDRMTALQLGPSASSRSRAFVLVVALDEENRFTMVDDVWVNALYAASSMSLAEAGDLFVSQLELELERASAAATREVTLNSEITGHLGFNPAQRSIVLALVPAGAPPPDNLPALGDHVP